MDFWYHRSKTFLSILLLPFSWIFRAIIAVRYYLYRSGFKKTVHFSVPVIVVGNITVGGTGKTPLVIWLANFLRKEGYHPGIVSRGYGGKQHRLPCWVDSNTDPQAVGDEAVLLAKRSQSPVVVCVDRVLAVKELLAKSNCNVVLADDGLQHYRLGRYIEVVVVDSERRFGNGCLLPAGPLREGKWRLRDVDFVVEHGKATQGMLSMHLLGNQLAAVNNEEGQMLIDSLKDKTVHAVAGIGHPERFFSVLRNKGLRIIEHVFPDHYLYCAADFNFMDSLPVIMTEKDAVKCKKFADERFWYLPVDVEIDKVFQVALLAKLHDFGGKNHASH